MAIPLIELGLGNPLHVGAGPVVVETTGRRSGLTRKVPLLSGRIGSTVAVATVRPDSLWMANLATLPQANVRLFGNNHPATASFTSFGPLRVALLHVTAAG